MKLHAPVIIIVFIFALQQFGFFRAKYDFSSNQFWHGLLISSGFIDVVKLKKHFFCHQFFIKLRGSKDQITCDIVQNFSAKIKKIEIFFRFLSNLSILWLLSNKSQLYFYYHTNQKNYTNID